MKTIYFDSAATTKISPEIYESMIPWLTTNYGNPSSKHSLGYEARKAIEDARFKIAFYLGVEDDPESIIFTSGGSEANNLAIKGFIGREFTYNVTTDIEHPSVLQAASNFVRIPVTPEGIVDYDSFKYLVNAEFLSIQMLNNITGMKQPMPRDKIKDKAFLHVDAVQSFGKMSINPIDMGIDMLSVSGHKLHAPKGIGFLYANKRARERLLPLISGEQEQGLRGGTENVAAIVGLAKATELAYENMEENKRWLHKIHDYFVEKLIASDLDYEFNCPVDKQFPTHLNVSFNGIRGEQLQALLDNHGICVSTGSACSSDDDKPNPTLKAMGYSDERCNSSIRFSFSAENTLEEIDYTMQVLETILPLMR